MRLIATRRATAAEVELDEVIQRDDKRYIVDEVHRTRTGFVVYGNEDIANTGVSRRKTFEFSADQQITVEAGEADRRTLLDGLQRLLAGDDHTTVPGVDTFDYDSKAGTLSVHLGGWLILLEA